MAPEDIPWDLVKLFTDAMEGCSFKKFNQLMAVAMKISNIEDKKYYYQLVEEAKKAHILVSGKDGYDQQGFFLNSPEQRKRILAYEEQQRQLSLSFVDDSENPEFPTTENPEPAPY